MSTKKTKAAERAERAAALLREQRARERRRNLITGGVVAAVLAVLVVVGILISKANEVDAPAAGSSDYGVTIGDPDADHTLVDLRGLPVPGVRRARGRRPTSVSPSWPTRATCMSSTGRSSCCPASVTTRCVRASAFGVVLDKSGPEVAKKFHDLLFAEQPAEGDEPYPDADWLVEKAVEAGANEADVRPGIEEGANEFGRQATTEASGCGRHQHPDDHPRR